VELLEREQCFADLHDWLTGSVEQGGCVTLVHGEAGIGKTALLQEFSRQQKVVSRVLWGACDALFTPRPLAPLHDIARQTQGKLLAALNAETSRDAIFSAALDELEHGPPALLVFEDCHWADEATFDLLKFLGRRMQRTRSMLVMTYRTDEVGSRHPCRFVIGDLPCSIVRRLPLQPLSEVAVAKLAKQAGRSSHGLYSTTGGNPFFVTEVLATGAESIPSNARDVVLARLAKLTPSARAIAELVSIVPGKAEAWLLEQAGVHDEAGIESCLSIGMVRDDMGSLAFRHDLARRALEDSLPQSQQQSLHAKVLAILGARPGIAPARLAHHADGARNVVEVLRFAPAAGAHAANVGAHREAVSHYSAALRYADNLPLAERAQLLERLSYECYLIDQIERAIETRRAALEIWRAQGARLQEGDALRWLSRLSWLEGLRSEADEYAAAAVAALESLPPGPELAMAYSNRAQLDMLAADADAAVHWAQRTLQLAEPAGYDEICCHALNNLGTARLIAGIDAGWDDLNRSLKLALAHGFQEHAARAYTNLAAMAVQRKQYSAAAHHVSEGLTYCERHDLDSWRFYLMAWRGRARLEQGDWLVAAEDAQAIVAEAGTAPIARIPALTILAHLRILRGDPDVATPLNEAREMAARTSEMQRLSGVAVAGANAAWIAGDRELIAQEVQPVYELARTRRDLWMKGELALWLWRAGALSEPPPDIAEPYALEISGDWRGAADVWRALGCPYEEANALASGGEAEQLEALTILERLGAAAAANALRRRMREQGLRRIPRGSRSSTRTNLHGLTKREAEIFELLAQGLRNSAIAKRLFVTTKTVDHHVSAIFTKLGVSSRAEAIAMASKKPADSA
jgi:DNA-binding CsgD family transcriptional regulator